LVNCSLIVVGACTMVGSLLKTRGLAPALSLVSARQRPGLERSLAVHRCLMALFVLGYLVVIAALVLDRSVLGDTSVSIVFLLGAVFVRIGVNLQSRLLHEVQQTLRGVVPICARCKRIRASGGRPDDPAAWKPIEAYISERADVGFTHGYCPSCYADEMAAIGDVPSQG
jgi:hypothetical protein